MEFFLVRIFLHSNWKIYGANLFIQSEYRKIRTRKNSLFGHFSRSANDIKEGGAVNPIYDGRF